MFGRFPVLQATRFQLSGGVRTTNEEMADA